MCKKPNDTQNCTANDNTNTNQVSNWNDLISFEKLGKIIAALGSVSIITGFVITIFLGDAIDIPILMSPDMYVQQFAITSIKCIYYIIIFCLTWKILSIHKKILEYYKKIIQWLNNKTSLPEFFIWILIITLLMWQFSLRDEIKKNLQYTMLVKNKLFLNIPVTSIKLYSGISEYKLISISIAYSILSYIIFIIRPGKLKIIVLLFSLSVLLANLNLNKYNFKDRKLIKFKNNFYRYVIDTGDKYLVFKDIDDNSSFNFEEKNSENNIENDKNIRFLLIEKNEVKFIERKSFLGEEKNDN